ncbi:MAG: CCA tRNA nucleotidyltransferase, partial [Planctomycetes bacterium]|nr:CCA tRNA nucleotidyltransferase [Planctomycetota bacterium]
MKHLETQWSRLDAPRRAAVLSVAETLKAAGYRAWLVGGAVRDLWLGQPVGDLDMVSSALPDEVVRLFPGSREVGRSFGIVQVLGAGQWIELATFRLERGYSDGRRPDEIQYTDSLELDAGRRDFTCNALYWDPIECGLEDPKGGLKDLERGELACVGDASGRFEEDGLRLLRMARFLARLGLQPAPGLFAAAASSRASLRGVSGERILEELRRMALGPRPGIAMQALASSKLLGLAMSAGESESLDQEEQRLQTWRYASQAGEIEATFGGDRLGLWLAILMDPCPGKALSAKQIKVGTKQAFKSLRISTALAHVLSELWRLRSFLISSPGQDSQTIRALRQPQGPLAWSLAQAWNRTFGEEVEALDRIWNWFTTLPSARVKPDFLPSGACLIENGILPGPVLGKLLR